MNNIPNRFPARLIDCFNDYLTPLCEMMIQLEMEFDKGLDVERLEKAVDLTLDAEPVLGCRFVDKSYKPYFQRLETDKRSAFFTANNVNEYEAFKTASIDNKNGSQINVCLWPSPEGDRLLLKVAHQVSDARGVKGIAAILSGIYRRLSNDRDYQPSPNIKTSRSIRQILRYVPLHAYPRICLNSVQSTLHAYKSCTFHTLPIINGEREPLTYVNRLLSSDRVSALVEYGRSRNATINDIILAASLRVLAAIGNRDKRSHLSLSTTIDLRRYAPSVNAEAVANLSTVISRWPDLGTEPGQDFADTLDRVVTITSHGKTHWIGLGILFDFLTPLTKIMSHTSGTKLYLKFVDAGLKKHLVPNAFTNTGPINPESVNFDMLPSMARILPPPFHSPFPPLFSLSGYMGTLTLSAGAYPTQKEIIEKFFDAVLKELPV